MSGCFAIVKHSDIKLVDTVTTVLCSKLEKCTYFPVSLGEWAYAYFVDAFRQADILSKESYQITIVNTLLQ